MGNINEVFERMEQHEKQMAAVLMNMDGYLQSLVTAFNVMERADVRGGFDVAYSVGLGATSPDNQTAGQVIQAIKRADGMLYGIISFNADSAARYARFYQAGAPPRVGSSPMLFPLGLPIGSGAVFFGGIGIPFADGMWVAASAGPTDSASDIASPTANTVMVVSFYK